MSDSDDTDVLLLIPPDLFLVPSSSSSDVDSVTHGRSHYTRRRTGVISELVGHMQSLESRLNAIESKDNSLDISSLNNTSDFYVNNGGGARRQLTLPRNRLCVSQTSSLQNTPVKPRKSLSVPSTPISHLPSSCTNIFRNEVKLRQNIPQVHDTNVIHTNPCTLNKHDLMPESSLGVHFNYQGSGIPHANAVLPKENPYTSHSTNHKITNTCNINHKIHNELRSTKSASNLPSSIGQFCTQTKHIQDMELSEVDELLQEMEVTELELSKRINSSSAYQYHHNTGNIPLPGPSRSLSKHQDHDIVPGYSMPRKLDFDYHSKAPDTFADISLPYNLSYQLDNTGKMISEFKTWEQNVRQPFSQKNEEQKVEDIVNQTCEDLWEEKSKSLETQTIITTEEKTTNTADGITANASAALPSSTIIPPCALRRTENVQPTSEPVRFHSSVSTKRLEYNGELLSERCKLPQYSLPEISKDIYEVPSKSLTHAATNTEPIARKSQQLMSLSDLWDTNMKKSEEEMLRIKLEEEKFRREHCEHLIQELQKRLLEQQEKVAVALRVDNEKNVLISQFHNAWAKQKQRVQFLETEHGNFQTNLKNMTDKHQAELLEYQTQIKRSEGELSKTLDLAAGYKEKSDNVIKEKVDLLRAHADELMNYKSLVQETENRYEQMKGEYNKLLEKNQQTEEALKNVQQELNRERLRGGEVRSEMSVIHKALDACEAELTVLKQEKESLQLKLKEEMNRNALLEQKNFSLLSSIDGAKKAEKLAKDEAKSIAEEKEKIRAELQEVYQKQVYEVVTAKLQEFQTQLDTAESEFSEELKTRQQVIAECAARKIKDIMDKHRLEITLLEEKNKEEKRLCELQLAQVLQKSSILETQLNSQRANKSHLAEQLHHVMQRQWQQALQIISGDNVDNVTSMHRMNPDAFFDTVAPKKSESAPNCYSKSFQEPMKLSAKTAENQHFHHNRACENQNESHITMSSLDDTPVTSKKESKDDLRKYIKMIAEMHQAREEPSTCRETTASPPPNCREVPRKHYLKKEFSIMSENSVTWQPTSEISTHEYSENIPISENPISRGNQCKNKPPWK